MKHQIKFMFDYSCTPLWSVDNETQEKFGYNIIELEKLGLSESTIKLINLNCKYYESRLNPIYQGFPSFWSSRMHIFFQFSIKYLLDKIKTEIGDKYAIENCEVVEFDRTIDVGQIDSKVEEFVSNPAAYSIRNGIYFNSAEELLKEVSLAYNDWTAKEYKFYSI